MASSIYFNILPNICLLYNVFSLAFKFYSNFYTWGQLQLFSIQTVVSTKDKSKKSRTSSNLQFIKYHMEEELLLFKTVAKQKVNLLKDNL